VGGTAARPEELERFQREEDEALLIDRLFPQVRISKFSGTILRDSRDPGEALDPTHGTQLIATADLAARSSTAFVYFWKTSY